MREREDCELMVYDLTKIAYVGAWDGCIGLDLWKLEVPTRRVITCRDRQGRHLLIGMISGLKGLDIRLLNECVQELLG